MKKVLSLITALFMLFSSFSFANNITNSKEPINDIVSTCTVSVSGYDEWGCRFDHSYEISGDISYNECREFKFMVEMIYYLMG